MSENGRRQSMNSKIETAKGESRRVKMTKRLLRDALVELLDKGTISKITVKEVCAAADVNRSTFYAYYTDLFALMEEVEDDIIQATPSINLYVKGPYEGVFTDFFEFIDKNRQVLRVLFKNSVGNSFRGRILNKVFGRSGASSDWIRDMKVSDKMHFLMLMSAFGGITMVEKWVFGEINSSPSELAAALSEFIDKN